MEVVTPWIICVVYDENVGPYSSLRSSFSLSRALDVFLLLSGGLCGGEWGSVIQRCGAHAPVYRSAIPRNDEGVHSTTAREKECKCQQCVVRENIKTWLIMTRGLSDVASTVKNTFSLFYSQKDHIFMTVNETPSSFRSLQHM